MAPRFDSLDMYHRKPLIEVSNGGQMVSPARKKAGGNPRDARPLQGKTYDHRKNLLSLRTQLHQLISSKPGRPGMVMGDEMSDPQAAPFIWVSKWVDYSDKYGFGYQLCDEGVGVMYNDTTKLIMLPNGKNIHYIDKDSSEYYYTDENYPAELEKKMKLLTYFRRYMNDHLVKAGASVAPRECDQLSRIPYLHSWNRTNNAVVMSLTNGTVQINFLDHTKIIMCPLMSAVTYHDAEKNIRTYRFSSIEASGCSEELANSLKYALDKITKMSAIKEGAA